MDPSSRPRFHVNASAGHSNGPGWCDARRPFHWFGRHGGGCGDRAGGFICSGTFSMPGVLAGGVYSAVTVTGVCEVSAGQAIVMGDVTVTSGSALIAAFGLNDATHSGTSGLTAANLVVDSGGSVLMGCDPRGRPCVDDPSQTNPTLTSTDSITGSLTANAPLGVVSHTTFGGDVTETGGGGGQSCNPSGIFAQFGSPVYSDFSSNTIGGNLRVTGVTSCFFGSLRRPRGGGRHHGQQHHGGPRR